MKWIYMAGLVVTLAPVQVFAGFKTGGEVYNALVAYDRNPVSADGIMALGYVVGVADSLIADRALCIPDKTTVGQVVQVAQNYLVLHPESWTFQASAEVATSLKAIWPCQ